MRVAFVTPWFPTPGAPESGVFVLRDALALLEGGHRVRVIHLDSGPGPDDRRGEDVVEGVPVVRVPFRRTSPGAWRRARAAVRSHTAGFDVVHSHALTGIIPFAVGRPGRDLPWVHTEHWSGVTAPETLPPRGRLARRMLLPLLNRPDVLIVACDRLVRAARPHRRAKPIRNVPCIVDAPGAVVDPPPGPRDLRLVGVGGIIPRKGPVRALEAVAELAGRGVAATLTWVGDGPQRAALVETAERLGLGGRLRLTGRLDEHGVAAELDAADLFILPTLGDNFCIVAAEALSRGRPIVSGADTGAVDYADPRFSEFVAEQSGQAYADAVVRLRARTADVPAAEVAQTVAGRFTPDRVAALLADVYAEAISTGRGRGDT